MAHDRRRAARRSNVCSSSAGRRGGGVGDGRLRTVGPSPWQLGGAVAGEILVVALAVLGLVAGVRWIRSPIDDEDDVGFLLAPRRLQSVADDDDVDDGSAPPVKLTKARKLAG